jgi:tetratricopeptide (TPR) repeat protein
VITKLQGSDDTHSSAVFDREFDNVAAAVAWIGTQGDVNSAVEVVVGLFSFYLTGAYRGLAALNETAAKFDGVEQSSAYPRLLGSLAFWRSNAISDAAAIDLVLRPLLQVVESSPEPVDVILGYQISMAYLNTGRFEDAVSWSQRAVARARDEHDDWTLAWALTGLAAALSSRGPLHASQAAAEEMLVVARRLDNRTMIGSALASVGWAARDEDPDRALELFEEAIELAEVSGSSTWLNWALCGAGRLRARRGDWSDATRHLGRAIDRTEEQGDPTQTALLYAHVAAALASAGDAAGAARIQGAADAINPTWGSAGASGSPLRTQLELELGSDAYATAHAEGLALDEQQAFEHARAAIATLPAG